MDTTYTASLSTGPRHVRFLAAVLGALRATVEMMATVVASVLPASREAIVLERVADLRVDASFVPSDAEWLEAAEANLSDREASLIRDAIAYDNATRRGASAAV